MAKAYTELADCGAVIVGSATHNNNVLPGIADVLTYMKGLRPLNRVGAAFGSYGWRIAEDHSGMARIHEHGYARRPCEVPVCAQA